MKTLILGGARSGKSAHAEQLASQSNKSVIYIATGWAGDAEMAKRIAHHQQQRPTHWRTVESPQDLAATLLEQDGANNLLLVDCLTLWISNCLANDCLTSEMAAVLDLVPRLQSELIFVSNEVGSGVVPLGELSRDFVDNAGRMHQRLATLCDQVLLVVAGLPLSLK